MGRSTTALLASGFQVMVATMAALATAQVQNPAELTLPATDINRESNNPAKQAIRARQAQEADSAEQNAGPEEKSSRQTGPVADSATVLERVGSALRSDVRTEKLMVDVRLEDQDLIALHGVVPSLESRAAVMDVATRVAGVARVRNHLIVSGTK